MSVDPAIQKILDDMMAYMGTTYVNCNASTSQDSMAITQTFSSVDVQGNRVTYSAYTVGNRVSVSPASASMQAGKTQQFTASVTDPNGNPISGATFNWSLSAGALGTVDANGLYTAPATLTAASSEQVTAQMSGALSSATVTVNLQTNIGATG
jgi:hypothetical protein